jgi:hypothetical protein
MNIALTSYRRPELTKKSLERLATLNGIQNIFIFIDGLRADANQLEREWREQTIDVCEKLAESNSSLNLTVWDSNIGVVENSLRSFIPLFEKFNEIIVLEEDVFFTQEGFNFIEEELLVNKSQLVTSFSHFDHFADSRNVRKTLFPTLWGTGYTKEIFELSIKVHRDKKFDGKVVEGTLEKFHKFDMAYNLRLKKFWNFYLNFAINSGRHPDVLLQYASWELNCFASAPTRTYSRDLSLTSHGAMNPRHGQASKQEHFGTYHSRQNFDFCSICEKNSSRIEPSSFRSYARSLRRRLLLNRE